MLLTSSMGFMGGDCQVTEGESHHGSLSLARSGAKEDIAVCVGVFVAVLARIRVSLCVGCREEG